MISCVTQFSYFSFKKVFFNARDEEPQQPMGNHQNQNQMYAMKNLAFEFKDFAKNISNFFTIIAFLS